MGKRFDSRIEEAIGRVPGLWWFDSRQSGDLVGWLHKELWSLVAWVGASAFNLPGWHGVLVYATVYTGAKVASLYDDWDAWLSLRSQRGPLHDHRGHARGFYVGFMVDFTLDVALAWIMVWLLHQP